MVNIYLATCKYYRYMITAADSNCSNVLRLGVRNFEIPVLFAPHHTHSLILALFTLITIHSPAHHHLTFPYYPYQFFSPLPIPSAPPPSLPTSSIY